MSGNETIADAQGCECELLERAIRRSSSPQIDLAQSGFRPTVAVLNSFGSYRKAGHVSDAGRDPARNGGAQMSNGGPSRLQCAALVPLLLAFLALAGCDFRDIPPLRTLHTVENNSDSPKEFARLECLSDADQSWLDKPEKLLPLCDRIINTESHKIFRVQDYSIIELELGRYDIVFFYFCNSSRGSQRKLYIIEDVPLLHPHRYRIYFLGRRLPDNVLVKDMDTSVAVWRSSVSGPYSELCPRYEF